MTASVLELDAEKSRLEAELDQLRVHLVQLEERLASVSRRPDYARPSVAQYEDAVREVRREIQRRKIALSEIYEALARAATQEQHDVVSRLKQENEAIQRELDVLRREVRQALLGMTDLLRRHQRLVERKVSVAQRLARLDGLDYAYENYLACSLLHKKDFTGDVQFVVDTLKKMRPVS